MSRVAFDFLFCPEGRVFVHNDCPEGGVLLPSSRVPGVCPGGWLWMKLIPALSNNNQPQDIPHLGFIYLTQRRFVGYNHFGVG